MNSAWHMSGAGNDFVVVDVRGKTLPLQEMAVRLCTLTGADGFLALDTSETADFRLHFYNADGLRGEMCGNGARCVCKFARDHGIVGEEMKIETDAGLIYGTCLGQDQYRVRLNLPGLVDLQRKEGCAYVELGNPGLPHVVRQVTALDRETLRGEGVALRHDPAFPKGANVNFYTPLEENRVAMLTYERGVEDFTLACGTGSAAVAVVLWLTGRLPQGVLIAENTGGTLLVRLTARQGQITALDLEGPAETLSVLTV